MCYFRPIPLVLPLFSAEKLQKKFVHISTVPSNTYTILYL